MKNKLLVLFLLLNFVVVLVQSQTAQSNSCGTDVLKEEHFRNSPLAKQQFIYNQLSLTQSLNDYMNNASRDRSVWDTIPVVFHVCYNDWNANPPLTNDSIIEDAMEKLNLYFARGNADTGTIAAPFKNLYVNSNIKFKLAKKDPMGNCTKGILYHMVTSPHYFGVDTTLTWDPTKYLNVFILKNFYPSTLSGVSGWANFPGSTYTGSKKDVCAVVDGALHYFPAVLSHEVGHWLNLPHVFGNSIDTLTCGDDGIADTPPSVRPDPYAGPCPTSLTGNICNAGGTNNLENIMHYHPCPKNFTQGQTNVMKATLVSSVSGRNNLSTSTNLMLTGVNDSIICNPIADFFTPDLLICSNDSIHFYDISLNGSNPTSWQWSFPGGSPATSNAKNPVVSYTSSGTFSVTLTVSNSVGSNSITKSFIIKPKGLVKNNILESFESINAIPIISQQNIDWYISNTNDSWSLTSVAAASGSKSIRVSPQFGTGGATIYSNFRIKSDSTYITFKRAYGQLNAATNNILTVNAEWNCTGNFSTIFYKNGAALSSTGNSYVSPHFVPTPNQWVTDTIYLPAMINNYEIKLMFMFAFTDLNNTGDIYIDDINFHAPVGTNVNDLNFLDSSVIIYPNPINNEFSIEITDNVIAEVSLFNFLGQKIYQKMNLSSYKETIDVSMFSSGIYFVKLQTEKGVVTKKIIKG